MNIVFLSLLFVSFSKTRKEYYRVTEFLYLIVQARQIKMTFIYTSVVKVVHVFPSEQYWKLLCFLEFKVNAVTFDNLEISIGGLCQDNILNYRL